MKLYEFKICQLCACPICNGEPVAGRDVGIARIQIDFPGPAAAQQHGICHEGMDLFPGYIEDVCATACVPLEEIDRAGLHRALLDYQTLANMQGAYNLNDERVNLQGDLMVDKKFSKTAQGLPTHVITWAGEKLFAKSTGAGEILPIKLTGTYDHPSFGIRK